jgi:hypothetical protein
VCGLAAACRDSAQVVPVLMARQAVVFLAVAWMRQSLQPMQEAVHSCVHTWTQQEQARLVLLPPWVLWVCHHLVTHGNHWAAILQHLLLPSHPTATTCCLLALPTVHLLLQG